MCEKEGVEEGRQVNGSFPPLSFQPMPKHTLCPGNRCSHGVQHIWAGKPKQSWCALMLFWHVWTGTQCTRCSFSAVHQLTCSCMLVSTCQH